VTTEREFAELLARGYELRGVEFKGPGARSTPEYTARVVRAALGMANLRDGGLVILNDRRGPGARLITSGSLRPVPLLRP
jgi:hypothetical protein